MKAATTHRPLVDAYLYHLSLTYGEVSALDLAALSRLQATHLTMVPFENLDVVAGIVPPVAAQTSVEKILSPKSSAPSRRGGWCFENNGAFAWLLTQLGFSVDLCGAAVQLHGPNTTLDHACLLVSLECGKYLVDVGFGDSFTAPIPFVPGKVFDDPTGKYQLDEDADGLYTLYKLSETDEKLPSYAFRPIVRPLDSFAEVTKELATNPKFPFKEKKFITRLIHGGPDRVTLLEHVIKFRKGGEWSEVLIEKEEWPEMLHKWFAVHADTIKSFK